MTAKEPQDRDASSEATRTSGSTDGVSRKERRHQIPGLRQTPYLRIFLLQCEDLDTYRNSARASLRDWIAKYATTQADSTSTNRQESHDASEWLIVLVEGEGFEVTKFASKGDGDSAKKSSTSRWKSKSPKSVIEKVRADFNTQNKNSIDRVALVSMPKADQDDEALNRELGDVSKLLSELINKMKVLILASFDRRVQQYEEDIREKEQQRNMPGWNFNTFFVLKEGLARGFESVGLVEDALSNYQELATGLETIITEHFEDDQSAQTTRFQDCTDDLQRILSRSFQDVEQARSAATRLSTNVADLGSRLLDTDRKPFRSLILENNISIFDFECYVFARQVTLLLRQANAKVSVPGQSPASPRGVGSDYPSVLHASAGSENENHLILARICHLFLAFVSNVTSRIRVDLEASKSQVLSIVAEGTLDSLQSAFVAISNNIVASWVLSACQSVLEVTDTAKLQTQAKICIRRLRMSSQLQRSIESLVSDGEEMENGANEFPPRSSSLLFRNPATAVGIEETTYSPEEAPGDEDKARTNEKLGIDELAAARGDVLSLARRVLGELGSQCKGWLVGCNQILGPENPEILTEVDLNDKETSSASGESSSVRRSQALNGIMNGSLQAVLGSKIRFLILYEVSLLRRLSLVLV